MNAGTVGALLHAGSRNRPRRVPRRLIGGMTREDVKEAFPNADQERLERLMVQLGRDGVPVRRVRAEPPALSSLSAAVGSVITGSSIPKEQRAPRSTWSRALKEALTAVYVVAINPRRVAKVLGVASYIRIKRKGMRPC